MQTAAANQERRNTSRKPRTTLPQLKGTVMKTVRPRLAILALPLLAALAMPLQADTIYWDGGSGNWSDVTKWSTAPSATTPDPATKPGAADTIVLSQSTVAIQSTLSLTGDEAAFGILNTAAASGNTTIQDSGADRTLTLGAGGITHNVPRDLYLGNGSGTLLNIRLDGSQTWNSVWSGTGGYTIIPRSDARISRTASDTIDRTLVLNYFYNGHSSLFAAEFADGGTGGSLALWKVGKGTLYPVGAMNYTGGTTISQGGMQFTTTSLPTGGSLVLRGTAPNTGLIFSGTSTTFTPTDLRLESGVNTLRLDATSTLNMGSFARSPGSVLRIADLSGQTYNTSRSNVNGILGPWAVTAGYLYVRENGSGVLEAVALSTAVGESGLTDPTANYTLSGGVTLTGSRAANTINQGTGFGQSINLGSSGENNLTLNGVMANFGGWTVSRSGSSTGKLIIGDSKELVITGSAFFSSSVPIVDNPAGASTLAFAQWINGATALILSGDNTYSGGTIFSPAAREARLEINSATALGTGPLYLNGVSGDLAGNLNTVQLDNRSAADITLVNNNAQYWNDNFTFLGTRGLNMGTGAVSLGSYPGTTRTVQVDANTLTIGGTISNGTHPHLPTTALTKTGAGTLALTGNSTYTGATTVTAGTLRVDGAITSNVTVDGATLQGIGKTGSITVRNGGIVAPGNSIGDLTVGTATFADGTLQIEIGPGADTDTLIVTGDLNLLPGSVLRIYPAIGWAGLSTDPLISVSGTVNGWFSQVYYDGVLVADPFAGLGSAKLAWVGGDLLFIPEPASAVLLGLAGLLARRRRRT